MEKKGIQARFQQRRHANPRQQLLPVLIYTFVSAQGIFLSGLLMHSVSTDRFNHPSGNLPLSKFYKICLKSRIELQINLAYILSTISGRLDRDGFDDTFCLGDFAGNYHYRSF